MIPKYLRIWFFRIAEDGINETRSNLDKVFNDLAAGQKAGGNQFTSFFFYRVLTLYCVSFQKVML